MNRPEGSDRGPLFGAICACVIAYMSVLLIAAIRANPMMAGILEFRRLMIPQIIAVLITIRGFRTAEDVRRFQLCMMALVLIVGVFVFWDVFFDRIWLKSDMISKPEYWTNRKHGRFGGLFLNPNLLGAFTVLSFPAVFVATLSETNRRAKMFGGLACGFLIFCLIETQSRGPLLAFIIVLALLIVGPAGRISRTRRAGYFVPLSLLLLIVMPGFIEHAAERFQYIDQELDTDGRSRQTTWAYADRIISDHPTLGIGFGEQQFVAAMNEYGFRERYGEESLDNPHNSYRQMTVYAGLPALAAFVLANILLLAGATRFVVVERRPAQAPLVFGITVALAGFLAVIYPDMHMFTQSVAPVYWVFFGLLLSTTTARGEPAKALAEHENSRPDIGDARQHLARQPAPLAARHRGDRHRAAPLGFERLRESRPVAPDGAPPRSVANLQQAPVQPRPVVAPVDRERDDGRRQPLSSRPVDHVRAAGADPRRRQH
jgi:O-antigen ligase